MRRVLRAAPAALVAAVVVAGCGSSSSGGSLPQLTIALDFTPNAVHAPIYAAIRDGLDRKQGVRLHIRTPGASPDSLKDVLSGAADIGVLDIQDLGLAVEKGEDVVAVGALVERPLGALIAQASIHRPRDLEGHKVGVSGLPSDPAFVRAIVQHDGGDFSKVKLVTIGFDAVRNLVAGSIAAAPVFWNAEGVALHQRGVPVREFRVDRYGAPPFPEVVLVVRRETLRRHGPAVHATVAAVAAGMADVRAHPARAAAEIAAASGSSASLVRAQLAAVEPIMGTALHRPVLAAWGRWAARLGILPRSLNVMSTFDRIG
jgi:NitT/TauT family transport system substrate-binding protein/putative hydroxymethylpyrimidine transport system substrate-binding protein